MQGAIDLMSDDNVWVRADYVRASDRLHRAWKLPVFVSAFLQRIKALLAQG